MRLTSYVVALLIASSSLIGQAPSPPSVPFQGAWVAPFVTTGTTSATISPDGSGWVVDMTGSCYPSDCQVPRRPLALYKASFQSPTYDRGIAVWDGPSALQYAILTSDNETLTIDVYTTWRDNSGRPNTHFTDHLVRRPIQSSTPVTPGQLVPRTSVDAAVKAAYQREFGETIEHPAIYNNPEAVNCSGEGHLTTTAYVQTGTTTTLLSLYMSRDASAVTRRMRSPVALAPAGTIRILVVLIRYPETVSANALTLWEDAQKQINDDHAAFAKRRGYRVPIVVFDNTNIMIDRSQIEDPHAPASVRAAAERRGFATSNYPIVMAIDINPQEGAGGLSSERSVYVGNYAHWTKPLDAEQWKTVARTAYHHEMAHQWGWPGTHDWAGSCGGYTPEYAPFIAPPILFGWEGLDGDGVPDILSVAAAVQSR